MAKNNTTANTTATTATIDQTVYNPEAVIAMGFENITDTTIITTPEVIDVVDSPMPDPSEQPIVVDGVTVTPTKRTFLLHLPSGSEFELHRIALTPDTATKWRYSRVGLMPIKGLGQAIYLGVELTHSGEDIKTELIACSLVRQNRCACQKDASGCDACPLNVLTLDDVKQGRLAPEPVEFVIDVRNN